MRLSLVRETYTEDSTIGKLYLDDVLQCCTLEDAVRQPGVKVFGRTAIPSGAYQVQLTMSPRFKRVLPLLLNVPAFDGVRIHCGNTSKDTEGCILVGQTESADFIGSSVKAFDALFPILEKAQKDGEHIVLTITDTFAEPPTATAPAKSKAKAEAK